MILLKSELLENDIVFLEDYINILEIHDGSLFNKIVYFINKAANLKDDC